MDPAFKDFNCSKCTPTLQMARGCGLPNYTGKSLNPIFKINFGEEVINTCPISYCDWTYVDDAITCWQLYNDKWLPDTYDEHTGKPCGIFDQSEFFLESSRVLNLIKSKHEAESMKDMEAKAKSR